MKNGFFVAFFLAIWGAIKLFFGFLKKLIQVLSSLIVYLGLYVPLFYMLFGVILLLTTDFTLGGGGTEQILFFVGLGLCCIVSIIIMVRNFLVKPFSSIFAAFRKRDRYDDEADHGRHSRRSSRYDERDDRRRRDDRRYADDRRHSDDYDDRRREDDDYYDDRRKRNDDYYDDRRRGRTYEDRFRRDDDLDDRRRRDDRYEDPYERSDRRRENDRYDDGYEPRDRRDRYEDEPRPRREYEAEKPLIYYSKRRPGVLVKEYSDRFELYQETSGGRDYIGTEYKDE